MPKGRPPRKHRGEPKTHGRARSTSSSPSRVEVRSERYSKRREKWDDQFKDPKAGPKLGRVQVATVLMVVGMLAMVGMVFLILYNKDPVSDVQVIIDPNTGVGPDENELRFSVEASRSYLSRDELFTGVYLIRYDNATLHQGTFRLPENGKAQVGLNFTEFYRDNGLYTLRVTVEGVSGTDEVEIVRTVHGLDPVLIELNDSFRLGLGLRPTDDPGDDDVVTTVGHGSASFYFVEQGNDTSDPGNWEQVERVAFAVEPDSLTFTIASDGHTGTGLIDLPKEYLTRTSGGGDRQDRLPQRLRLGPFGL